MPLVAVRPGDGQPVEGPMGVRRPVVVRAQHLRGIRLAEPPQPADADEVLGRANRAIDRADQSGLVDIPGLQDALKPAVAGVQVSPHALTSVGD